MFRINNIPSHELVLEFHIYPSQHDLKLLNKEKTCYYVKKIYFFLSHIVVIILNPTFFHRLITSAYNENERNPQDKRTFQII